ncbi:hypothetical protein BGZ61DRAFT_449608 [Ilyonectria robusta]|uniref:uncharacterized protein n=1 Tax=Ilyonectria robusta TaxID=1079257 RepID=UPI001E8CE620|nr:uncharacterized protein BGZ61DRAFT_449608 [Ilyonectria robusta]KAH8706241.1 hypothetical protein BGZ61DRAFT_449608 [Ilyonectria robusta]
MYAFIFSLLLFTLARYLVCSLSFCRRAGISISWGGRLLNHPDASHSRPSVPLLGLVQGMDCGWLRIWKWPVRVGHNGNNSAVCLIQHAIGWSHEEVVIASPFVLPAIFERKLPLTSGAFSRVWLVVAPPYCLYQGSDLPLGDTRFNQEQLGGLLSAIILQLLILGEDGVGWVLDPSPPRPSENPIHSLRP